MSTYIIAKNRRDNREYIRIDERGEMIEKREEIIDERDERRAKREERRYTLYNI